MTQISEGFSKLQTPTVALGVYNILREAIITSQIPMGIRINEKQTAEKMGVSVTPVREALRLLERDGLVNVAVRRGTFVAEFDAQDAGDLYDVRLGLEMIAAKRVLEANRPEDREELIVLLEESIKGVEARDLALWGRTDTGFHLGLIRMTGNIRLCETYDRTYSQIRVLRKRVAPNWDHYEMASADHQILISGIRERDRTRVIDTLVQHIERGRNDVIVRLQNETLTNEVGAD